MTTPLANILLVDDRAEDRAALEVVLAPLGQNLILAESGQDALRRLFKTELAVILLDVQMPLLDGLETARLIRPRERSQSVPIIFITGTAVTGPERFKGYETGAVDYLLKPVMPDESYIAAHTTARFSHGLCPECTPKYFPGVALPQQAA